METQSASMRSNERGIDAHVRIVGRAWPGKELPDHLLLRLGPGHDSFVAGLTPLRICGDLVK